VLRPYQTKIKSEIITAWNAGHQSVLAVMPTGAGKTVTMASVTGEFQSSAEIAHRQELVFQIAMAHAMAGIYHRIIAPPQVIAFISNYQARTLKRSFVHNGAGHAIVSVDTVIRRQEVLKSWFGQVGLAQTDEGHHALLKNKWGVALGLFPKAWKVAWTATPLRADRKGLRRGDGLPGVYDHMVVGPSMRWLIEEGHLCDYQIYGPKPSIDRDVLPVSDSGEFKPAPLRDAAHKSTITGDLVQEYLRLAPGKRGVSFVVDTSLAAETVAAFQHHGVPAALITAETPDAIRVPTMEDFRRGFIKQICNVDILGEGVDVPGIEVVSMGRPTESYGLYAQQFGRMLRPMEGKTHGILIDHVGNVIRHGLPDAPRIWSLDAPERRTKRKHLEDINDEIPLTTCTKCKRIYPAVKSKCPHCLTKPVPGGRERPEQVDGDLLEYSAVLLAQLRGQADAIMGPAKIPYGAGKGAIVGSVVNHNMRAAAQRELRDSLAWWAGVQQEVHGLDQSEQYRTFYHRFGVDVATAQTYGLKEATALKELIWKDINR
jgi:DNA repair protein RadD